MAKPKASKIEQTLRNFVVENLAKGIEVTVKSARTQVEKELGLDAEFFKNDEEWKPRSREIIQKAAEEHQNGEEEAEQDDEPETPKSPVAAKVARKDAAQVKERAKATPQQKIEGGVVKKSAEKSIAVQPSNARDEDEGSSEDGEDDEEDAQLPDLPASQISQTPVPHVNGVKRKASANGIEAAGEQSQPKRAKTSNEDESTASEAETGSSSSVNENEEEQQQTQNPPHASEPVPESLRPIPAQQFKPPKDYIPLPNTSTSAFSPPSKHQQIWHLTAPSNIPLTELTDLALSSIGTNTPIFHFRGNDYALQEATDPLPSILVPGPDGRFRQADGKISRQLLLRQNVVLPEINLGVARPGPLAGSRAGEEVVEWNALSTSRARQQPKGLRMRFRPPGAAEVEESEAEERQATFRLPRAVDAAAARKDVGKGKGTEVAEKVKVNGVSATSPPLSNGAPNEEESKEERKKRKEEKRARKEAKRKAKEASV